MVSLTQFLGADGVSVRWRRLAAVVFGAGVLAYFEGVVATVLSLADIPIALASGFGNWLGEYYRIAGGFPAAIVRDGFGAAIPYVRDAGFGGFLFAIVIVLTTLYSLALVIDRVR